MSTTSELQNWLNGTINGGPNSDGRYPLTAKDGQVFLVYCPAAQALNPAVSELPVELFTQAAEQAAANANTSAIAADTARLAAQTQAANAAASATDALAHKNAAAASVTTASGHATAAGTSATNAAGSATTASGHATTAGNSATAAAGSATSADTARTAAELARDKAQKWADELVDTAVEAGKYSAKHWAQKAADSVAGGHVHTIANVTGLQIALDGKQPAGSYAAATHGHAIGDVTGLQGALDGKQAAGSYAAASHAHAIGDVTGLQGALDGKQATIGYTPVNKAGDTINGNLVVGDGSDQKSLRVKGAASGTAAGSFIATDVGAENVIALGNYSALFGGSYNISPTIYTQQNSISVRVNGVTAQYTFGNTVGTFGVPLQMSGTNAIQFFTANYYIRASTGLELYSADFIRFLTNNGTENMRLHSGGNLQVKSYVSSEGALCGYQFFERQTSGPSWVMYANNGEMFLFSGVPGVGNVVAFDQPNGNFKMFKAGNEFSRANANSGTLTRQPRVFVQSGDPGAAAADGDLWIW